MAQALITAPELHEELGEVALFDIRWELGDPAAGHRRYLRGHIPGAVFVDLERDLTAPEGPGRHPLPAPADWARTLGRLGVTPSSDVVVYDDVGGGVAARMWWMLRSIGHRGTARVLDGGWRAWVESGFETDVGEEQPAPTTYPVPPHGFHATIDAEGVVASAPTHLLLDARSPERFRGDHEPIDPVPGHIPGAVNAPWQSNLRDDERFKDAAALRRRYESLGADRRPVIISCGSGVTACHLALALEIAGLPRPMLYEGSYSDWSSSGRPVEGAQ